MLLISLQADWCNHHGRNLEYLEGQLEGHRLLQRNKMEIADRQVVQSYAAFFLRYSGHKQTFDVNHCAYVFVSTRLSHCHMQLVLGKLHFTCRQLRLSACWLTGLGFRHS